MWQPPWGSVNLESYAGMPRYYFNIRCNGFETADLVGEDCSTLKAIKM